jgi:DeoR/GlpR family transcriptional regulator of sugar metabolism
MTDTDSRAASRAVPRRASNADLETRRRAVLTRVLEAGEMSIDALAEEFAVSLMTMHRDLDVLAERRLLRKLRGRAAAVPAVTMETASSLRAQTRLPQKEALAAAALDELPLSGTLLMDDSTTLFPLVRRLDERGSYTVITNSVGIARLVAETRNSEAILLGGRYQGTFDSTTGPEVLRAVHRLHADVAIMSAIAITEGHLYHPIQDFAVIKEAMLDAADRHLLLVDSSKFGRRGTFEHGDVRAYNLVITDAATPPAQMQIIRALGVPLRCVAVPDGHLADPGVHPADPGDRSPAPEE